MTTPTAKSGHTPEELQTNEMMINRVRDAQYLHALKHFDESKSKALQLLKESNLPLYIQRRLFILLSKISDDYQEKERFRQQAESISSSFRSNPEAMFDELAEHVAWNAEDLKEMADIQAEYNDPCANPNTASSSATVSKEASKEELDEGKREEDAADPGVRHSARKASNKNQTEVKPAPPLTGGWMKASDMPIGNDMYNTEKETKLDALEDRIRKKKGEKQEKINRDTEQRLRDQGLIGPHETLLKG